MALELKEVEFNLFLQKMYARLDARDWLLINEDKRPSVITSSSSSSVRGGNKGGAFSSVAIGGGSGDGTQPQPPDREFQIVIMAKQGT